MHFMHVKKSPGIAFTLGTIFCNYLDLIFRNAKHFSFLLDFDPCMHGLTLDVGHLRKSDQHTLLLTLT